MLSRDVMVEWIDAMDLEVRTLRITRDEMRERIEKLEKENAVQGQNLSAYAKDLADALDASRKREERIERLQAYIKDMESRPTLAQQGRMLEDLNMLQAKLNASEEHNRFLKAENEKLVKALYKTTADLDNAVAVIGDMSRNTAAKSVFIPGLFFAVGFALASLLWWSRIF